MIRHAGIGACVRVDISGSVGVRADYWQRQLTAGVELGSDRVWNLGTPAVVAVDDDPAIRNGVSPVLEPANELGRHVRPELSQ